MIHARLIALVAGTLTPIQFAWAVPVPSSACQVASNRSANDYFGTSVAISGDTMVVGVPFEDSSTAGVDSIPNELAANAGAAYVYVREADGKWKQQAYLKSSNSGAEDQFGFSVAISGDVIVVGAYQEDSNAIGVGGSGINNSAANSGAVYVFTREGDKWLQTAYLKASNAEAGDLFGYSVAISGDKIAVGATGEASSGAGQSNNTLPQAGAVYVFTGTDGEWDQSAYLKASTPGGGDLFGFSLALTDERLAVGATGEASGVVGQQEDNSAANAGAVYVFTANSSGSSWQQDAYIKASNVGAGDSFGRSVGLSGTMLAVGAPQEDSDTKVITSGTNPASNNLAAEAGAVYVFTRGTRVWEQQAYIKSSQTLAADRLGTAIALDGDTLVCGASGRAGQTGAAYEFVRIAGTWSQQRTIQALDPVSLAGDHFGVAVAISDRIAVVGAYGQKGKVAPLLTLSGATYTFEKVGPWVPLTGVTVGLGTILIDKSEVVFSAAASSRPQEQFFTIENTGLKELNMSELKVEFVKKSPSTNEFVIAPSEGLAPVTTPLKLEAEGVFSFKVVMTGSGQNEGTLTIKSDDPNFSPITIRLVGRTFSTNDSDGDGLSDIAEYQLRTLGFDWQAGQTELVETLRTNSSLAGLYSVNSALALGIPLLDRNADGTSVSLRLQLQQSSDLKMFTKLPLTGSQVTINADGEAVFQFKPANAENSFFRLNGR